jgi:Flp pilus assembly protein TadG
MPKGPSLLRRILSPAIRGPKAFGKNERGAVLIEFALLALPFFTLIYAILETSIVFLAGQILDSAVQDASRKIRTGESSTLSWTVDSFRDEVCEGLYGMFNCDADKLIVKVEVVTTFGSATVVEPVGDDCMPGGDEEDCEWTITPAYDGGVGSSIVLVQAYYKWPTLVNVWGFNLSTQAGGTRLLSAVRVFRNEPYS